MMTRILYMLLLTIVLLPTASHSQPTTFYVSLTGNDNSSGTLDRPFRTLERAKKEVSKVSLVTSGHTFQIIVSPGTYFLDQPLVFQSKDFGSGTVLRIRAEKAGASVVSAGKPLLLHWEKAHGNIWKAKVPATIDSIPALYGKEKTFTLARFPNKQGHVRPFEGYDKNAMHADRIRTWQDPTGGYLHALHEGRWGGMHFQIIEKPAADRVVMTGGWQNNRPSPPHGTFRFVENIREELDAPGEWFFDRTAKLLYYYPEPNEDIRSMEFIAAQLENCLHFAGDPAHRISHITVEGLQFAHTTPTFMLTKEPLLRSDWRIYRQGAIWMENAESIHIQDNIFRQLGGNAVFISGHNRYILVKDNLIEQIGASGIAFVGRPSSLHNPLYQYSDTVALHRISRSTGPRASHFPEDCQAVGNLIRHIGLIEKQSAGVQIQVASRIAVLHNTIYRVPRAGINIGDGAFGGYDIAYNDVFETVLETSDHGAFNSWGRDRFWRANRQTMDELTATHRELILLDAYQTTHIHHNRFHCDHGWDIDLDDGSSNYRIYANVCLSGGIKLREGFHRSVYQNILINNTLHPHVWFVHSQDTIKRNILMSAFNPIQVRDYGSAIDSNIFFSREQLLANQQLGVDRNGIAQEIAFKDPDHFDFTVMNVGALNGFFTNMAKQDVGVKKPELRALAATPPPVTLIKQTEQTSDEHVHWLGYRVKTVSSLGEQSATGLAEIHGVLVLSKEQTDPDTGGLEVNDVILSYDGDAIRKVADLLRAEARHRWKERHQLRIWRNQQAMNIRL
ncbi:PDZ domain-containing protein [Sphingobacterium suaedae]|uniref:PDZ domain-containing protein n=1 Tax=Sphingobacterium suaedae TaxID=1686402 RepID=A0ABW5KHE0_9SPHI